MNHPFRGRMPRSLLAVAGAVAAAGSLPAQAAAPAAATPPPAVAPGAPVELTPFTVSTDRDEGFAATSALAGGRLATDLRDTPAAYSVITREFIDALSLNDLQSAAEWSAGSDSIPNNGDATFFTFSTYYQTRGVRAGTQQRNFFPQYGDNDTFNIERFDFGRGPNSILFGNGTLGGTSSSTTKRARTDRAFQNGQLGVGSWNTYRATVDVNQPVGKRAAVRVAGVWGDGDGWREKDFNKRKGAFATTTFRPWRNTEIRLEGEYLAIQKQTGMTTLNDRLSGWNGALAYSTPTALRGAAAAVVTAATAAGVNRRGANYHVWNPSGGLNAVLNLEGEPMTRAGGETATTPIAGFTSGALPGSPTFASAAATFRHAFGLPAGRFNNALANSFFRVPDDEFTLSPDAPLLSSRFKDLQLTINQRFGDFYFEAAADINRQAYFVNGEENRGSQDSYIDINRVLADGSPNRHFLQPYGDGSFFRGYRNYDFDSVRCAAAWVKNTRFGKFTVNSMGGRSENHYTLSYRWLSTAQGADQSQWILPAQFIRVRRYWNENAREITDLSRNPIRYLNPGVVDTQIRPRWVIDNSRFDTETVNDANYQYGLVALNAKFWRDRLVLLGAVRRDSFYTASQQQVRTGDYPRDWDPATPLLRPSAPADWAKLTYIPKDAQGRATGPAQPATARPRATDRSRLPQYAGDRFQDDFNAPPLEGYRTTKSIGTVFHVTRWLSPFVNFAETFNPATAYNVLINGNLVPPTVATGVDVGTRLELFQGNLNLSFTYYQNQEKNRAASISGGPQINNLYRAIPQGSTTPLNRRGQNLIPTYVDISQRHGTGFEFEATANLKKGFRLTGSVALPKVFLDDANSMTRAYIDAHVEVFRQIVQDASVRVDPTTNLASVDLAIPANERSPDAQTAADAYNQIFQFRRSQIEGRILDQQQPLVKLFADYTLQTGRFKGLRGGLGVRWSGKRIIGDRANDTRRDPANPGRAIDDPERTVFTMVYAPEDSTTVTGTLAYSFRLFERSVQANLVVNNLLNDRSVTYLGTAQRPRDGDYTSPAREAVPNGFSFKQPVNFNLTFSVKL